MKKSRNMQKKLYRFLREAEKNNLSFSKLDIQNATGYAKRTIPTYFSKKLIHHVIYKTNCGEFKVIPQNTICSSIEKFRAHMTQTSKINV